MSTPATDVRRHADVVKAALAAANVPAFEYSDDKSKFPGKYALLSIEERYVEPTRGGRASREGWRLSLRLVGGSVFEAHSLATFASNALRGKRLVIDGHTSTPLAHESSQAPEPDDGKYSGLVVYVYAL